MNLIKKLIRKLTRRHYREITSLDCLEKAVNIAGMTGAVWYLLKDFSKALTAKLNDQADYALVTYTRGRDRYVTLRYRNWENSTSVTLSVHYPKNKLASEGYIFLEADRWHEETKAYVSRDVIAPGKLPEAIRKEIPAMIDWYFE